MRRLLILVDLQEDFLRREGLSPHRDSLTARVGCLLQTFRENKAPILHIRTRVTKTPDVRMPHWKSENRWLCLEDSAGYRPPPLLREREREGEEVLHKTGFSSPGLADLVAGHDPQEIVLCGIMLHACVRQTAIQLHEAGLKVTVADDGVGSDDPVHAAITRRYLLDRGVEFLSAPDIHRHLLEPTGFPWSESAGSDHVDRETKILFDAQGDWEGTPFEERARFVSTLARTLEIHATEIADRMAAEIGKPVRFGKAEMERSAEMIGAVVGRLRNSPFGTVEGSATIRHRPHGSVAIITPWNNPVYIPLGKILPALLCGNTVAWKPAPEVAEISRWLLSAIRNAGLPDTVFRMIAGPGENGRNLVESSRIDAVSLTGSQATGYRVGEICARRHIPFQAELGGNNPAIVWSDADLRDAANKIVGGAFEMAGQRCTANRRVIVDEKIAAEFTDMLVDAASRLCWGDAANPNTDIGPLVSPSRANHTGHLLRRAADCGFPVHFPLGRFPEGISDPGRAWSPPCIVECDDPAHELVQEEAFAPILVVQRARDWEHALALANGVRQGLAAALFTQSEDKIADFQKKARAGILKINASTADAAVDVPFGGWKASGIGPPEHGEGDFEFYTRNQTLYRV